MLYTHPSAELACLFLMAAAEAIFVSRREENKERSELLGMVGLFDIDRLKENKRGWTACTSTLIYSLSKNRIFG